VEQPLVGSFLRSSSRASPGFSFKNNQWILRRLCGTVGGNASVALREALVDVWMYGLTCALRVCVVCVGCVWCMFGHTFRYNLYSRYEE
jgi:hypothetical protein